MTASKKKFDNSIRYILLSILMLTAIALGASFKAPEIASSYIEILSRIKPLLIGVGGLALVLVIWMIRMNARVYISNQHLYDNAEQREIMIQTFLAMKNEDKAISEEDKAYILGYLFKSTGDGLVRDEGVPSPLVDILTKVGQKQ